MKSSPERRLAEKWVAKAMSIAVCQYDARAEADKTRLINAIVRRLTNTGHYGPG